MAISRNMLSRLRNVEIKIAEERGEMALFALYLRKDAPERWDLVIAAPWIGDNRLEITRYVAILLSEHLSVDEAILISRIVLLEPSDAGVIAVNRMIRTRHSPPIEQEGNMVFGFPIATGYVVTSQRLSP